MKDNDLKRSEKLSVDLTRVSWHVKRIRDGYGWAARNEAGEVKSGSAENAGDARSKARDHAYS